MAGAALNWTTSCSLWLFCVFGKSAFGKDTISVVSNAIDNGYYFNGIVFMGRGVAYGDLGRQQEAIEDFSRAIEVNPTMRDAYKFRGSLYAQAGQMDLALADLNKYVTMDSADV